MGPYFKHDTCATRLPAINVWLLIAALLLLSCPSAHGGTEGDFPKLPEALVSAGVSTFTFGEGSAVRTAACPLAPWQEPAADQALLRGVTTGCRSLRRMQATP